MNSPITIDDHDPQVKYSGTWITGGGSKEVNSTVSSSTNINDSLTLQFNGTQIGVYGTIDGTSGGVVTSYAIDGGTATQATSPAAPPYGNSFHQQFWTSPVIPSGNQCVSLPEEKKSHGSVIGTEMYSTLVVTMVEVKPNSTYDEGTIWFDYFLVTPDPAASTSPSTSSSKCSHAGAIFGAVAGGVVSLVVVLLAVAVMGYRRALRRQREKTETRRFTITTEDGGY